MAGTVALSHLQSSRGWSGMPRTVRSSTRCRLASPVSHCLAPCIPETAWRGLKSRVRLHSSGRARAGQRRRGGRDLFIPCLLLVLACVGAVLRAVSGSVGGDRENRVLGMGQGSGSRVVTLGHFFLIFT
ncbi:hypothetical protein Taro_002443 [Colocasia esculenta]|uniref:Peptidase S31 domain-containing protein n=1 Tax=Colocasia esculenta TaxID=4460 RepID=A0A843TKU6_COLES|nr:hypothetical protein [Colocasia esculenta]